jgi:hypothetical protein
VKEYRQLSEVHDEVVHIPCEVCGEQAICGIAEYGDILNVRYFCDDHRAEANAALVT